MDCVKVFEMPVNFKTHWHSNISNPSKSACFYALINSNFKEEIVISMESFFISIPQQMDLLTLKSKGVINENKFTLNL